VILQDIAEIFSQPLHLCLELVGSHSNYIYIRMYLSVCILSVNNTIYYFVIFYFGIRARTTLTLSLEGL
jgi:hypothetical protein